MNDQLIRDRTAAALGLISDDIIIYITDHIHIRIQIRIQDMNTDTESGPGTWGDKCCMETCGGSARSCQVELNRLWAWTV